MTFRKLNRGFSLIEVVMAIVILSVALLSLAQLMMLSTRTNALAGRTTSASSIAKAQLERLKAATFYTTFTEAQKNVNTLLVPGGDLATNVAGYHQFFDPAGLPTTATNALYVVRWQIEDLIPTSPTEGLPLAMKRISVRCLPSVEKGSMFQTIGDAILVTYRTANVG